MVRFWKRWITASLLPDFMRCFQGALDYGDFYSYECLFGAPALGAVSVMSYRSPDHINPWYNSSSMVALKCQSRKTWPEASWIANY